MDIEQRMYELWTLFPSIGKKLFLFHLPHYLPRNVSNVVFLVALINFSRKRFNVYFY